MNERSPAPLSTALAFTCTVITLACIVLVLISISRNTRRIADALEVQPTAVQVDAPEPARPSKLTLLPSGAEGVR